MNVVSILAHQDDEFCCLGTMLKCRDRGDRLFFITTTDGSNGMVHRPGMGRKEAAAIRDREMSAVAAAAGGEYINLGIEDEFLFDTRENRLLLIEAIRRTRADLIFTHYPTDYNQDHITTHDLVRQCAMNAALPIVPTQSPPLAKHPAIFLVPPTGTVAFPASYFVDVTQYEDRKVEYLKLHLSQEESLQQALGAGFDKFCRIPDAYWGLQSECEYAEAFIPMEARGAVKPYPVLP
ncbi:MAG: PIG-L family deacetylase [Opitutaceae bacterium]|nr:PIG-L family deacetylase [Opitutaceae bacterium]